MNLPQRTSSRATAILITLLLITGGMAPFVGGTHVNDLLAKLMGNVPEDETPTGVTLLDAAIKTASQALDQTLNPLPEEPQLPATFFHDWFPDEPSDRIGGWGDWMPNTIGSWTLSPAAAGKQVMQDERNVTRGYRFGGPEGYPVPPPGNPIELASPVISLRSLPIFTTSEIDLTTSLATNKGATLNCPLPPGPAFAPCQSALSPLNTALQAAARQTNFTNGLVDPGRILLYADQRFNFAIDANGQDEGSVLVRPEGSPAVALQPLSAVAGQSRTAKFTGQSPAFTEEAFDLTQWAGKNVQIVFRVSVAGNPELHRQALFNEGGCNPLCGWDISNIRIEGPSYLHNVRLEQILYPAQLDDKDPAPNKYVARPGAEAFSVLILNRGQVTETVDVLFQATWPGGSAQCTVRVSQFLPGDARKVRFREEEAQPGCSRLNVLDNVNYAIQINAMLLGAADARDAYLRDNQLPPFTVRGDGPEIILQDWDVTARLLLPGDIVGVDAALQNLAITDGSATVGISIDYRHPSETDFTQTNVQGNKSLVEVEGGEANRTLLVPARTINATTWDLRLHEAGVYRLTLRAIDPPTGLQLPSSAHAAEIRVGVQMAPDDAVTDYDLSLVQAGVDTEYRWDQVGFGPGTNASATLTFRNLGFFTVEKTRLQVTIQDETVGTPADANETNTWSYNVTLDTGFALRNWNASGDEINVHVPIEFPPIDGNYRVVFRVDLLDQLITGSPAIDRNPGNDCLFLRLTDGMQSTHAITRLPNGECPIVDADAIQVKSFPRLDLDLLVSPEDGRTGIGFPREVFLQVHNLGNVLVKDARVTMRVRHAASTNPEPDQCYAWTVSKSPLPGQSKPLERLERTSAGIEGAGCLSPPALSQITLGKEGMYFVFVFLVHEGFEPVFHQVLLRAFDTIYSDTFEPRGVERDFPALVDGETLAPFHAAWNLENDLIPDGEGKRQKRVWWFGDSKTGQYAPGADAVLEMPRIDLSPAKRSSLGILHNYDLEEGYDGARVEASVDGGTTWLPLEPKRGNPGSVAADSPLNGEHDPTLKTPAFTGNSSERNPATEGWVVDEFDLTQLPNFTTQVQVVRFNQDRFDTGPHMGSSEQMQRSERATWHPDWRLPSKDCRGPPLEGCWYRDNVNWRNPLPLCHPDARPTLELCKTRSADLYREDHHYWWSGTSGALTVNALNAGTTLEVDFHEDVEPNQEARLVFWYWKDPSGMLIAGEFADFYSNPADAWYRTNLAARFSCAATSLACADGDAPGGWARGELLLPMANTRAGGNFRVHFQYLDRSSHQSGTQNLANRGAAIGAVQLEVSDPSGIVRTSRLLLGDKASEDPTVGYQVAVYNAYLARDCENVFESGWGQRWTASDRMHDGRNEGSGTNCVAKTVTWEPRDATYFCHPNRFAALCTFDDAGAVASVNFGWARVPRAIDTDERWGTSLERNHQNEFAPVWRFGTEYDSLNQPDRTTYLPNAAERLVTPLIDLRDATGNSAALTFWEMYDLMPGSKRRILAQAVEFTPTGIERPAEWAELPYSFVSDSQTAKTDRANCTDDFPSWCPAKLDISPFIGMKARFAFEISSTRLGPLPAALPSQGLGWTWLVDEVGVQAESMVAQPLRLRLRAATDGSINEGHWKIQNVQLVGLLYDQNIAVVPEAPLQDRVLAPGESIRLTGSVRNVGTEPTLNQFLNLDVMTEAGVSPPTLAFLRNSQGKTISPWAGHTIGPINLNSAGARDLAGHPTDRIDYSIEVTFPSDAPSGVVYQFVLRAVDDAGAVLTDENLGDHERAFDVEIGDNPSFTGEVSVQPPTLESLDQTARITLELENTGTRSVAGAVNVTFTRLETDEPKELLQFQINLTQALGSALAPGDRGRLQWNLTPSQSGLVPGFYRVTMEVMASGMAPSLFYGHVLIGSRPLFYLEDFTGDPFGIGWTRNPTTCVGGQTNCWRHSTVYGSGSLFVGDDQGGAGYPAANTAARTGPKNLSFLARDPTDGENGIRTGASPFGPYLSLKYKSMLDQDHEVTVQGRAGDSGPYAGIRTVDARTNRSGSQGLTGLDDEQWFVAGFPLFAKNNSVLGDQVPLLNNGNVSFQFTAALPTEGSGRGFAIDLVTVSAYAAEVSPRHHEVVLRPGSAKTFYFRVTNTGAAKDTYQIQLAEEKGNPLLDFAKLVVPKLQLEPGESGLAAVRIEIPYARMEVDGEVELQLVSSVDPNRIATGIIHVGRFIQDKLPGLVTDLRRPRGDIGPLQEGEQATFVVTVANEGTGASRETDLLLFACPKEHLDPTTGTKQRISIDDCGRLKLAQELGETRLPPLLPSIDSKDGQAKHAFTTTFSWIPPLLHGRGEYYMVAVADPMETVPQFDRFLAVDWLELVVAPLERPDVNIVNLRVMDARGDNVTSAYAGDVLHIEGTVRNDGDATASNVRVRIVNRFALRDERIGDLAPGMAYPLSAQWVAQPGNWVVLFEASTSNVEAPTSNNAQRWSLAIRSGTVDASWIPDTLHLSPGASDRTVLRIDNRRDQAAEFSIGITATQVLVDGVPDRIQLPRGSSRQLPLLISASPFADAGRSTVRVDLIESQTRATLASAALEVYMGAQRGLRLTHSPLFGAPGTMELPLKVHNDGSSPEAFAVHVRPPTGWTATVLQPSIHLAPGENRTLQTILEIPAGTTPGTYDLDVSAGDVLEERLRIDVMPRPVWRSEVKGIQHLSGQVELVVDVENLGNVRATPRFATEADEQTLFHVDPPPGAQEPTESRTYLITVGTGHDAPALFLPGHDAAVPLESLAAPPPVEAVHLDLQVPTSTLVAGHVVALRVGLRSVAPATQPGLPVRLWMDGVLIAEERFDLSAGETRDVEFHWRASGAGTRVLTATVGSGDEIVARTLMIDVTPAHNGFKIPGTEAPTLLALFGLAAVVLWRRRDR